jgi:acyl-CoA dehydrogenase
MALTHFFGRPQNILMACKGEQIERYLAPAVSGDKMDALAMTEPGAGSDVRGMSCSAVKYQDGWKLNGTKHFISGAEHADFFIVFVATGEDETPRGPKKRITTFLVDRGTKGFEVRDGYESVSHRGYTNKILNFDDCYLSDEQVLGDVDGGFAVMNEWLYATRITVATMCVGRARRCFDLALHYAAERKQFGQQIGKFQGVGFQLADMITEIDAADWLTLSSAWRLDQNLPANREIASAKVYASEMLAKVTDASLQVFGGMGLMNDLPIERFWRDARVERIWDGTSEIQRHIIARDLLRPLGA